MTKVSTGCLVDTVSVHNVKFFYGSALFLIVDNHHVSDENAAIFIRLHQYSK